MSGPATRVCRTGLLLSYNHQFGSERGPVALPVFKIGRSPFIRGGWVRLPGASANLRARMPAEVVHRSCEAAKVDVDREAMARQAGAAAQSAKVGYRVPPLVNPFSHGTALRIASLYATPSASLRPFQNF